MGELYDEDVAEYWAFELNKILVQNKGEDE